MVKAKKPLITEPELGEFVEEWASITQVKHFNVVNATTVLAAEMQCIQPEDIEVHRQDLRNAHARLVGAVFWICEKEEIRKCRLLVWWARFRLLVAERKARSKV